MHDYKLECVLSFVNETKGGVVVFFTIMSGSPFFLVFFFAAQHVLLFISSKQLQRHSLMDRMTHFKNQSSIRTLYRNFAGTNPTKKQTNSYKSDLN